MSYRIRRIDPFWLAHPLVYGLIAVGLVLGGLGYKKGSLLILGMGSAVTVIGLALATRPVVSAMFATMGFFGGLLHFALFPGPQVLDMTWGWRIFSWIVFMALYMGLMNALVLVICALYNFWGVTVSMGGINLDIEEVDGGEGAGEGA